MSEVSDRILARVLGQELRRAREGRGWTRAELAAGLPSGIGERTLLSYEHGVRALSVARFIEICGTLGVAAAEILDNALEKACDLRAFSFTIDLRAMLRDERAEFEPVRLWARNRLNDDPSTEVLLTPVTVREMASMVGVSHATLASYLVNFASGDLSRD